MATQFDFQEEVAPDKQFDFVPEEQPFDFEPEKPDEIKLSPYEQAKLTGAPSGMEAGTEFLTSIAEKPSGFPAAAGQAALLPFGVAGKALRAGAEDIGASLAGAPEQGGNVLEFFRRTEPTEKPMPYEQMLAQVSKTHPYAAFAAKTAGGLIESAPIMVAGLPEGLAGKLIGAGFTVDMIRNAYKASGELGAEMGKPPEQRDQDKITTLLAEIAQSATFAPMMGAHVAGKPITERFMPRRAAIEELSKQLTSGPIEGKLPVVPPRIPVVRPDERGTPVPGLAERQALMSQALKEAQQRIFVPGEVPAIELLRRQETDQVQPPAGAIAIPTRFGQQVFERTGPAQAEPAPLRPQAPGGKVSFLREAEAPLTEVGQRAIRIVPPEIEPSTKTKPAVEKSRKSLETAIDEIYKEYRHESDAKKSRETPEYESKKSEWFKSAKRSNDALDALESDYKELGREKLQEDVDKWITSETDRISKITDKEQRKLEEQSFSRTLERIGIVISTLKVEKPIPSKVVKPLEPTVTETTPPVEPPSVVSEAGLVPAIREVGGKVDTGKAGDVHNDIIADKNLKPEEIDQRGFVDADGNFVSREKAAAKTGLPTNVEPQRLHSTDLPEAQPKKPISGLDADVARENEIAARSRELQPAMLRGDVKAENEWLELQKEFQGIKNKYEGHKPSDIALGKATLKTAKPAAPVVPEKPVAPTEKQPWEMTMAEFDAKNKAINAEWQKTKQGPSKFGDFRSQKDYQEYMDSVRETGTAMPYNEAMHRSEIKAALREGKPVPEEVLKDYPDLVKPTPTVTEAKHAEQIGGVPYFRQLGEMDALNQSRKRMRSVPQNFKLAYLDGWYAARKKAKTEIGKIVQPETEAINKVQAEVTAVAKTEGARPAKEVKSELVAKLEKAIDDAPASSEFDHVKGIAITDKAKNAPAKITINIPGDGDFTIVNRKENVTELLARAKRIKTESTAPTPPRFPKVRPTGNIPADVWVESSEPTHEVTIRTSVKEKGKDVVKFVKRLGKPIEVKGFEGKNLYLTSDGTGFSITEPITGLRVGGGDTIPLAIKDVESKVSKLDKWDEAMKRETEVHGKLPDPTPIVRGKGLGGKLREQLQNPPSDEAGFTNLHNMVYEAGQAIYRKGMEFADWSKRMIERYGDPIRQFLKRAWDRILAELPEQPPVTASEVLARKRGETTHQDIQSMSDAEVGKLFRARKDGIPEYSANVDSVLWGAKQDPALIPELERLKNEASAREIELIKAAQAGKPNIEAQYAAQGRRLWYEGALEGLKRKGGNYEALFEKGKVQRQIADKLGIEFRGTQRTPTRSIDQYDYKGITLSVPHGSPIEAVRLRLKERAAEYKATVPTEKPSGRIEYRHAGIPIPGADKLVKKTRDTLKTLWQTKGIRSVMAYTKDATQAAQVYGQRVANDIRGPLRAAMGRGKKPNVLDENALTFVIESGGVRSELANMRRKLVASTTANTKWKAEAIKAIDHAESNWDKLEPIANEYSYKTDAQISAEHAAGINTVKRSNYVMHVQDVENDFGLFDASSGEGTTGFKHIRTFPTFADSIAAGVNPKSINAITLLAQRVARGQQLINNRAWVESLRTTIDPKTGKAIITNPEVIQRGPGMPPDIRAPQDYVTEITGGRPIAVLKPYSGIFRALTQPSAFRNSVGWNAMLKTAGAGKSVTLILDTFHLGRLAFWESIIKPLSFTDPKAPIPSFKKGVLTLDYSPAELRRMAARGEIPMSQLPALLTAQNHVNQLVKRGYNIAKISDSLHQEWIQELPILGTFNKWLFNQFQRGAMAEVGAMEVPRYRRMHPSWTEDQVYRAVAKDLNTRFGNLGRQGIFKSRTAQDLARTIFLAPQWNEGLIRSEVGAVTGTLKGVADSFKEGRPAFGVLPRAIGAMMLGQFVANQIINFATRGKPTWQNEEEGVGAKLSAWVPDVIGQGPGFFLHPAGLAAEITHLLTQKYEKKGDFREALMGFLGGRWSTLARPVITFLTRRDVFQRLIRPEDIWKETAKTALPLPIGASAAVPSMEQMVGGEVKEKFPGQYQRQLMASVGVKADQAPSALQRIQSLKHEFNKKLGVKESGEFYESAYVPLRQALSRGALKEAQQAYQDLLKANYKPKQIADQIKPWTGGTLNVNTMDVSERHDKPFTGTLKNERKFVRTLTPEQRRVYELAKEERKRIYRNFVQMKKTATP